jgi:hypothetical protein
LKNLSEGTRRAGRRWQGCSTAVALCAALWLAPLFAGAQPLEQAIDVRTRSNQAGAQSQGKIDKVADQTDELLREYREEVQQIDALRVYNAQLEKLIDSQENEKATLREQIENVTVIGREVTPLMLRMVEALEQFVALDVPFLETERSNRVNHLKELMDRADVTNAEKYRRILEAYQIENEYGRTIEAYRGSLDQGSESLPVDFLRIGRVVLLYQSLDASELGVWDQAAGKWQPLDRSYRGAIRKGLRVARKQAAPDLLRLPVQAAEDVR